MLSSHYLIEWVSVSIGIPRWMRIEPGKMGCPVRQHRYPAVDENRTWEDGLKFHSIEWNFGVLGQKCNKSIR